MVAGAVACALIFWLQVLTMSLSVALVAVVKLLLLLLLLVAVVKLLLLLLLLVAVVKLLLLLPMNGWPVILPDVQTPSGSIC